MVLYIDACVRENSRTRELAEEVLKKLPGEVEVLNLYEKNPPEMSKEILNFRMEKSSELDFCENYFDNAKQLVRADYIVIAAPFWDLSFPAILKKYIESVCITGLTMKYSEKGVPTGLCRAKKLFYITTAGGEIFDEAFSFGYIKNLFSGMLGVKDCVFFSAQKLDIFGVDTVAVMEAAKEEVRKADVI